MKLVPSILPLNSSKLPYRHVEAATHDLRRWQPILSLDAKLPQNIIWHKNFLEVY